LRPNAGATAAGARGIVTVQKQFSRKGWGTRLTAGVVAILVVAGSFLTGTAGATGAYAGETISLSVVGQVVQGRETHFLASGKQADVSNWPGGFNLDVFAKNTSSSPTCSPSFLGEEQASLSTNSEERIVIGLWDGLGQSFSVPFVYTFPGAKQVVLCAYSTWVTDTAAAATLTVNVKASGTTTTAVPEVPVDLTRPSVQETAGALECNHGSWRNAASFAYHWLLAGQTLAAKANLKGEDVTCVVTAANAGGVTTVATSFPFLVH
jgi:hypothetical protein